MRRSLCLDQPLAAAPASAVLGQTGSFTGINLNFGFDKRLLPTTIRGWSTNGTALDVAYNFNLGTSDNGNVNSITNNRDATRSQSFTYDQLNRVATAQTSSTTGANCWGETFSYDIWGNLLSIGAASGYAGCTQENLSVTATTSNRVSGDTYDASGNLTLVPGTGGASYAYNGENQMTSTAGVTYTYDGDGKRVQKSNGKLYWYGMGSDALDETGLSGNLANEYVFFGGKRIARRDSSNNIFYYFADHLGTSRVITNAAGSICYHADLYPFGGERPPIVNTCSQNYKFTGKERDTESNLDNFGARYGFSSLGRFMSPDEPLIDQDTGRPRSWNLYSYVRNNPLNSIDPNGHDCVYLNDSGNGVESIDHNSSSEECNEHGGRWANGTVEEASWVKTDPNSDTVHIFSHYRDVVGQTWAGPGWSHGDKYADMISPEKIEEMEDRQILLWTALSITLPHFGAGFTEIEDVTQPGSRFPSIRANLTPEEFGENLEATGYTKGITKGGATTYTKGDKQYTLYTASSTRGPSAQVKVSGEVVSKIRLQ